MHSPSYRSNPANVFSAEIANLRPEILSGWKEIANYLHMSVRTVQRNEHTLGIPVRRPISKSRGPVITTTAELDGWVTTMPVKTVLPGNPRDWREAVLHEPFERISLLLDEFCLNIQEMTFLHQETARLTFKLKKSLKLARESLRNGNPE